MPDHEKLDESPGNLNISNEHPFFPLCPEKDRQQATMTTAAAVVLIPPPPSRNPVAIYPLPCHSAAVGI
jgi:hypothetical protein